MSLSIAPVSSTYASVAPSSDNRFEQLTLNTSAIVAAGLPPGLLMPYAGALTSVPSGWLLCDGAAISRTTYAALFAVLGTLWGPGDGATTFNVPDFRSKYAKGWTAGVDPGGATGAATHSHGATGLTISSDSAGTPVGTVSQPTFSGNALAGHQHGTGTYATDNESSHTHAFGTLAVAAHTGATAGAGTGALNTHFANSGDKSHTVSGSTAAGSAHNHTLSGSSESVSAGTPAGTVSQPSFSGSALGSHTHTPGGNTASASSDPLSALVVYLIKT